MSYLFSKLNELFIFKKKILAYPQWAYLYIDWFVIIDQ